MMMNRLSSACITSPSQPSSPSIRSMCVSVVVMSGLDFGCCFNGTAICVSASETRHECWLCGAGLDDAVVVMHFEGL